MQADIRMRTDKTIQDAMEIITNRIEKWQWKNTGKCCLIAIDGRSASGKTTLAAELQKILGCSVIHMDHFFLQPGQRTKERLEEPGGNVDRERFQKEVVTSLQGEKDFSYRIFDCGHMDFKGTCEVRHTPVILIEGAYSCHPKFVKNWDITVFLSVEKEEQMRRIEKRNGRERAVQFAKRWIPLEEKYFETYHIEEECDIRLGTR